jgi:hypothetical protein
METDTATQEAMGKMVMAQMQQQMLQTLKVALRQELLDEVKAEAFEAALADVADELHRERERLRDTFAKDKRLLEGELEDQLEARSEALRREAYEHYGVPGAIAGKFTVSQK